MTEAREAQMRKIHARFKRHESLKGSRYAPLDTRGAKLTPLGTQGQYSATFITRASDLRVPWIRKPKVGDTVLVKIATLKDGTREADNLRYLNAQKPRRCGRDTLDVRAHVPVVYAAGPVRGTKKFAVIMEYLPGKMLGDIDAATRRSLGPKLAERYDTAIRSMLYAGVVHGDLHDNNVMFSKARDGRLRAYIIDFGFAVKLPSALRKTLVERLCVMATPRALNSPDIRNYVRLRQRNFGRMVMHWNSNGLERLQSG